MKVYKVVSKVETYVEANSEEDAKVELIEALTNHCVDQIDYYKSIEEGLCELEK